MTVPKHLEEAITRIEVAEARIDEARKKDLTPENLKQWLEALTEMCLALSDVQSFSNESVHEKLHALAARMKLKDFS